MYNALKHCQHCKHHPAAAAAKSRPTLCDPIDGGPTGSSVPGILQARILEWVAISFSSAWKWKVNVKLLSHVWLLATPWTEAYQAPPSMGFFRWEYWSGLPLPSPSIPIGSQSDSFEIDAIHLNSRVTLCLLWKKIRHFVIIPWKIIYKGRKKTTALTGNVTQIPRVLGLLRKTQ